LNKQNAHVMNNKYFKVLCLSPTYELAIQTGEVAARMGQFCREIKLRFAVRGEEGMFFYHIKKHLKQFVPFYIKVDRSKKIEEHILIGTPGKLLDWGIKFRLFDMKKISVFVLDEADVMIATQGHHDQCIRIHKYVYICYSINQPDLVLLYLLLVD